MLINNVEGFYNRLADEYDSMTSFDVRIAKELPIFSSLIEKYKIKTALDAGCGTGVHSLVLGKLGVEVVAVDISSEMIHRLHTRSKKQKLKIKTIKTDFLNLPAKIHQQFDAIFCMGNSLAHAKTQRELLRILSNFYKLLNPNGLLFIQILNYDRIISRKEIIQNIKESDGKIYIRFYCFTDKNINFNIIILERKDGLLQYKLQTTTLRPIGQKEIVELLKRAGFKKIDSFGSIMAEKFIKNKSKDLFIIARK